MTFGQFLAEKRQSAGLSQKEVSKFLGYTSSQFVSNWERNISLPTPKSIPTLARIYQTTPEEILEKLTTAVLTKAKKRVTENFQSV